MPALTDVLTNDSKKSIVVEDCLVLLEQEVSDKGGLSGIGIKAGYAAIKNIRPGFVKQVITDLLPEFATALDPIFQEAQQKGAGPSSYFATNASRAADLLLAITDGKAQRSKNALVKGTYDKLRGIAKKNVEAAMPRLGKLIEKHSA